MMRRALILTGVLGLVGAAGVLGGLSAPRETAAGAAPGAWTVDPVHSSMVFRIKHMKTAYFYGTFNDVSGTINFDDAKPEGSSLEITVKTDSIETHNQKRNSDV